MQPGLGQPQALRGARSFREPLLLMFSVIRDCLKKPFPISPCRARYPLRSRLYWGDSYSNLTIGYYSVSPFAFHNLGYSPVQNSLFYLSYAAAILAGSWLMGSVLNSLPS